MRHPVPGAARTALCALMLFTSPAAVIGATAAEPDRAGPTCSCSGTGKQPKASPDARAATAKLALDGWDETATLHAVLIGLTEVPDGGRFVWRRSHGRLSGVVRPMFSFRNSDGAICRHLELTLRSGDYSRTIEGTACRQPDGRWSLDG